MELKDKIVQILNEKSLAKYKVIDNTLDVFNVVKSVSQEIQRELNQDLKELDPRLHLEYKENGRFECQLKVAGDLIIFNMHSNVFEFNRDHNIKKTSFAAANPLNTYCGIISIYNFLNDSFKCQRNDDLGYLIGRVFINKDLFYMIEGKRQLGFMQSTLGINKINREVIKDIILNAIQYSLEFDLLVPPYDSVKIVSVAQMTEAIDNSRFQTGKRIGFKFNSDDVATT